MNYDRSFVIRCRNFAARHEKMIEEIVSGKKKKEKSQKYTNETPNVLAASETVFKDFV